MIKWAILVVMFDTEAKVETAGFIPAGTSKIHCEQIMDRIKDTELSEPTLRVVEMKCVIPLDQ